MKANLIFRRALPFMALLLLHGCLPPQANFEIGLGTTEIVGSVLVGDEDATESGAIIVILKNHYKFIPLYQSDDFFPLGRSGRINSITHPTAHFQQVGPTGKFVIPMPSDVVSVDIMFIAAEHLTDTFRFSRSLGMGRVTYNATLPSMPDWRSHFYTFLEPQLQELIVESRYHLPDREQQQLGDWLLAQKKRIETVRGGPGEGGPRDTGVRAQ